MRPLFLISLVLLTTTALAQPMLRPNREARTINTGGYELSVQQNGRVDVLLTTKLKLIDNAVPMVWFAGEEKPRSLEIRARDTGRIEVNDALGKGQGMGFASEDRTWYLRTYPTQPFFVAQLEYRNTSKEPQHIAQLIPWAVVPENDGRIHVGPGAENAQILDAGVIFRGFDDYAQLHQGVATSNFNIALYNAESGFALVAGTLSNGPGYGEFQLARRSDGEPGQFQTFTAACVYDPPVILQPGEVLKSAPIYIAVAERDPVFALARYGRAVGLWNGVRNERPFVPHGWDSWSTHLHRDISEDILRRELDVVSSQLTRYGWKHFAIDAGWEQSKGDWDPNPARFPNGLKPLVDTIHARGMTAGLWIDPFTVDPKSQLAQQHPEWLLEPSAKGRLLLGDDKVLDVSRPEVYAWVVALARKIRHHWGFDALVEADFVYHLLLADGYQDASLTRVELLQRGMRALREGIGNDAFLMTMTPQPINGVVADGIRVGRDNAPVWTNNRLLGNYGAVESLTNAARRFYYAPWLFVPDQDCAFFGKEPTRQRWNVMNRPPLTRAQSIAWLTGAALTGGAVKIGDAFSLLNDDELAVLRKLLPSPERPARPLDLFNDASPRVWSLPFESDAGQWQVLALFNWNAAETPPLTIPLAAAELEPQAYYTVFDFWGGRYLGTARGELTVHPEPGSVLLLGLRRYRDHPMFIASDRHWSQGAMEVTREAWDAASGTLTLELDATPQTAYALTFLAPEGWHPAGAAVNGKETALSGTRDCLVRFDSGAGGKTVVTARFTR